LFPKLIKTSGTPTSTYGKFSSIATQEGVVNVTPLTTLVAFYGNQNREFYFSSGKKLGPSLMDNLTPVGVAQWQAAVKMALSSAYGLNVSVVPDLISTPFTATNGNAIDRLLEDYKTAVAAANAAKKGGLYFGNVAVSNSQARFNAMFNETETAKASGGTFVRKPTGFSLESIGGTAECSFAVEIDGQRLAMFTGGGGSYFPALSSGSHTVAVYMGGTVGGRSAPEGTAARKCGARVTFVDKQGEVGSVGADTTGTRPVKWVFSVTVA
jgi:hypothetical protein